MSFCPLVSYYIRYTVFPIFSILFMYFFYKKVAIHTLAAIPANVASSAPANV